MTGKQIAAPADHFLRKYSENTKGHPSNLNPGYRHARHTIGQKHELENVLERASSATRPAHGHHLPPTLRPRRLQTMTTLSLSEPGVYEKYIVVDALKSTRGNRAKAARLLGTTERIINYKVRKYAIDGDRFRD
jgi:Nif-specific regulatory protein